VCSERLLPPSCERPARLEVTGFWQLEDEPAWTPEEEALLHGAGLIADLGEPWEHDSRVADRRLRVSLIHIERPQLM